jgi:hypothetical protein
VGSQCGFVPVPVQVWVSWVQVQVGPCQPIPNPCATLDTREGTGREADGERGRQWGREMVGEGDGGGGRWQGRETVREGDGRGGTWCGERGHSKGWHSEGGRWQERHTVGEAHSMVREGTAREADGMVRERDGAGGTQHAGIALMTAGAGGLDVAGAWGTMALLCSNVTSLWFDLHALCLDG